MTPRELREALYYISDQKMTVEDVRKMLYSLDSPEYDQPLEIGFSTWINMEARRAAEIASKKELKG